jgi:nucleotide-binding universal stress UspA family protein
MNVLLGIDGTDGSVGPLEDAIARVREAGDDLTVAIFETGTTGSRDAVEREVRTRLDRADADAEIRHIEGDAGSRLVELADSNGFDRLVIAGGERSPLGKISLDETIEFVLLNCQTTVTLLR